MNTNLGALVMRLVLEARQFRQDLDKEVSQTEAAVGRLEKSTTSMGGAVKDVVAGQSTAAASATRALAVLGPVAAGLTVAVGAAAIAYMQGTKESQAFEKSITLTGNAAGVTVGQLGDMARAVDKVVGTQGQAAATLAQMVGSGRIAGENLQKFTITAQEMERSVGTAVGDTVKQFAELGEAPVKASLKLNESMNYLTASTYAQIKAAMELGDEERAASIAQNAYADAMVPRIATIEQSLGLLERAWRGVKGMAREAWDSMLNVGRPDTMADQIANVRAKIEQAQGQDKNRPFSLPWDTPLADLQQQLSFLTEQERMIKRGTEAQTERNRVNKDAIAALDEVGKANERALTKQQQADKALADYRKNLAAIRAANNDSPSDALAKMLDPTVIAQTEAAIKQRGETAVKSTRAVATEQEKLAQAGEKLADSLTAQASGLSGDFGQKWAQLNAAYEQNGWSVEKLTAAQAALLAQQPAMKAGLDAETKAAADLAKTMDAYAKANAAGVAEGARAATQAEQQLANYGLLKSEVQELTLEMMKQARESAALAGEDVSNIEERIKWQKRLVDATRGIEQRQAVDQATKESTDAAQKMADSINGSLTDALMRGFESGKGFAANLGDTVENMFKTMVLRPIVSFILSPISGALGGLFGMGGAMAGQGGGAGALGTVGNIASGASLLGGLGAFGGGLAGGFGGFMGSMGIGAATGTTLGGALSAGGIAMGAGNIAGAMGTFIGALGPIALGIGLLASGLSRTLKDSGIEGTFGGDKGFEGRNYKFYEGGFLRSDKTTYSDLDEQVRKTLGDTFKGMKDQVTDFADALGLTTDRLTGYTSTIKLSLHGLSDADAQKKIQEALATANDELAQQVIGTWTDVTETVKRQVASTAIEMEAGADSFREIEETITRSTYKASEFAREGEKAIDTLTRLATSLTLANTWFARFGATLFDASLGGGDKASSFIDAAGGADAFNQQASSYFNNFYTSNQRSAAMRGEIEDKLGKAGVAMPQTAAEFRKAMDAFLAMGDAGKEGAAALFSVADAFAQVNGSVGDLEQAMGISAQSIKGILDDVRKGAATPAEAGKRLEDSIYEGLGNAMTQGLSQMIMSAVVGPLVDGLLTGATGSAAALAAGGVAGGTGAAAGGAAAGGAVAAGGAAAGSAMAQGGAMAGAAVAATIDQARAYMAGFAAIMNDPGVRDTIREIADGFSTIAGDLAGATGGFQSASTAMASAGSSAGSMGDSITSLGDSIEAEVKRLRGLMTGDSPQKGRDALLAEFTTATAQARAGDQSALEKLPGLSQSLEEATRLSAGSSVELARMRGWLAGSLVETQSKFAVQTDAQWRAARANMTSPGYDIRDTPTYSSSYDANPVYHPWEEPTVDSRYANSWSTTPLAGTGNLRGTDPNAMPDIRYTGGGIGAAQYDARDPRYVEDWRYSDTWSATPTLRNPRPGWYGPAYEQGTNYVPNDGLAMLHKGEMVVPAAYNPAGRSAKAGGQSDAVVQELRALRTEVAALRTQQRGETLDQQRINLRTAKMLERWEQGGMPTPRQDGVIA